MNPLHGKDLQLHIATTEANRGIGYYFDPTKNNVGQLKNGHKVSRLCFSPTASKATAVYVETAGLKATILSKVAKHKFISLNRKEIDGKDEKMLVNIGSLSKRLSLSASQIKKAAKEGTLVELMKNSYQKHLQSEELRENTLDEMARTDHKHVNENSIKMLELEKIIFVASKRLNNSENFYSADIDSRNQNQNFSVYITKSETENRMNILAVSKKILGEGSYGRVFKATDLTTGESHAVKRAKITDDEMKTLNQSSLKDLQYRVRQHVSNFNKRLYKTKKQCIATLVKLEIRSPERDAQNELLLLQRINPQGDIPGIQRPPHRAYPVTDYEKGEGGGYIAPFYNIGAPDYTSTDKLTGSECFDCIMQLLQGGTYCSQQNIVLGDIKPGNCLMEYREGKYHVVLSDFGGAKELSNTNIYQWGTSTTGFFSQDDFRALNYIPKNELLELHLKRDVYALGKTLNKTFLSSIVVSINQNPTSDRNQLKNDLEIFVRNMTAPRFKQRCTMKKALDAFTAITRKHAKTIANLPKPIANDTRALYFDAFNF